MEATRITKLRDALGLTRERFAEALGVSTSTLQRWERGSSKPSPREREFLEALQELSDQIAKEGREKVARAIEVMAKAGATAGLGLTAVGLFMPLAPIFGAALGITSASLIKRILDVGGENPEPAGKTSARPATRRTKK